MEDRASHHVAAFHLDTAVLITRQLAPDTDLLALHRRAPQRYPVLLESVAHGTAQARWDLLLVADGEGFSLDTDGVVRDTRGDALEGGFLGVLDRHWQTLRQPREELRWPFRGGWALFLGYELGAQIEPVLRRVWEFDGRLRAWHDVRADVQAAWQSCDPATSVRRGRSGFSRAA